MKDSASHLELTGGLEPEQQVAGNSYVPSNRPGGQSLWKLFIRHLAPADFRVRQIPYLSVCIK